MSTNNQIAAGILSPFVGGVNAIIGAAQGDVQKQTASDASSGARSSYASYAATEKATILADTSIDSISKQELLNELAQGSNAFDQTTTTNSNTYDDIANTTEAAIADQLKTDRSDDPLHQGRRYLEQQFIQQQTKPGRAQTILTSRTNTDMGTPTLLTSGPGSAGGVNLTTPGSILTGKTA